MSPAEKLAQSLEVLHALQEQDIIAIRSGDLSRTHRERLSKNGFLQEVIKGWYIPARPDETAGESTAWYTSFWKFCASYLNSRFGSEWCLSPEQSLFLHTENWRVPQQLLVRSPKANNNITALPHDTSLLDIRAPIPAKKDTIEKDKLRLFSLAATLVSCSERNFTQNPNEFRTALSMIQDSSEVLGLLLEGGHSTVAGRLAGAFRNIGNDNIADDILDTMRSTGYDIREQNPFKHDMPIMLSSREQSPYVNRIRLMWQEMRETVIHNFPTTPEQPINTQSYLKQLADAYTTDAYHSLS
ncbi:MAG TPA: cell filamentation protein Fic, partial [Leucothrix sp.]|nr:cell filamentation protein Fic [Leucothrix sp.]